MELRLPMELANQILGYLAVRPYQEVYQLIDGMKEAAKPKQVIKEEQKDGGKMDSEGNL